MALASQDVLSNLFGGVIILLDKPLGVGDKVRIDPYVGTVMRVGLRSTRIRTLDGLLATVPNSRITTNIVVNYSAGSTRARAQVQVPVTVAYDTPVGQSRAVLEEIAKAAPTAAPPAMELGEGTVQIGELGRVRPGLRPDLLRPGRDGTARGQRFWSTPWSRRPSEAAGSPSGSNTPTASCASPLRPLPPMAGALGDRTTAPESGGWLRSTGRGCRRAGARRCRRAP